MSPEIALVVAPRLVASSLVSSADVGDPAASRTVYLTVVGLVAVAVALVVVGVWLIRQTRIDPELLAPLEEMQTRRWRRTDPVGRRRLLDEVRPNGAVPQVLTPQRPEIDAEFGAARSRAVDFDDLVADGGPDSGEIVHGGAPIGAAGTGHRGVDPLLRRTGDPGADGDEVAGGVSDEVAGGDESSGGDVEAEPDGEPVADVAGVESSGGDVEAEPDGEPVADVVGDEVAGGVSDEVAGGDESSGGDVEAEPEGELVADADGDEDDSGGDVAGAAGSVGDDTGEVEEPDPFGVVEGRSGRLPLGIPGEGLLGRVGSAEQRSSGDR